MDGVAPNAAAWAICGGRYLYADGQLPVAGRVLDALGASASTHMRDCDARRCGKKAWATKTKRPAGKGGPLKV